VRALSSHAINADSGGAGLSVQDLSVLRIRCEDPFRWRSGWVIVDIFRRQEFVADHLKGRAKMPLANASRKRRRVAKQETFKLVELEVRDEPLCAFR
jgi:hypothetical protein